MSLLELLLLIIVIAGAAYAGYMFGRASVLREIEGEGTRSSSVPRSAPSNPLPAPADSFEAPRRSSAPPPASAGGEPGAGNSNSSQAPPRRSAAPPPARAGLMSSGDGSLDGTKSAPTKSKKG